MITAIAIDDEPIALDILREHAGKVPFVNLQASFQSAAKAQAFLEQESVQLVFADINMPDMSGLEFAERLHGKALVIFTTAHPEFAINGFELAATDYLLKPIPFNRFLKACQLAKDRLSLSPSRHEESGRSLFIKDGYNWVKINLEDLLYAKAEDNYVALYEAEKTTLTRMTLAKLIGKLPAGQFIQVHKSFVVALSKIQQIEKNQLTVSGKKIPVSDRFKEELVRKLNR